MDSCSMESVEEPPLAPGMMVVPPMRCCHLYKDMLELLSFPVDEVACGPLACWTGGASGTRTMRVMVAALSQEMGLVRVKSLQQCQMSYGRKQSVRKWASRFQR